MLQVILALQILKQEKQQMMLMFGLGADNMNEWLGNGRHGLFSNLLKNIVIESCLYRTCLLYTSTLQLVEK